MISKISLFTVFILSTLSLIQVANAASNYVIINASSCTDSEADCQLSNVQSQDGTTESQAGHQNAVRFIETVNSNSSAITSPNSIDNVTVYIDRFESANPSGQTITLSIRRPSDNVATSCTLQPKLTNDSVYNGCAVTSLITGSSSPESDAEGLTISYRVQALGATNTFYLDHAYVNITYTDSSPPTVILNSPANNSWSNSSNVTFQFTPNDVTSGISSCTLVLDSALNQTNSSITEDQISYITSTLPQGSHNWTVNCTDTSANANVGTNTSIRTINVDLTNTSIQLNSPANRTNSTQTLQSFNFTATDNLASSFTCRLFVNSTNVNSTTVTNNTSTILTYNLTEGMQQWYIQCEDLAINVNVSETRNITIDFTNPRITNVTTAPSSEADLDPNATVNVTSNITDNVQVNQIVLQYKLTNVTEWNETSMTLLSGNLYRANFTATDGNWSYRIIANDTVGNQNITSITNISVITDRTWENSTVFPSVKAIVQDEPRLFSVGNLTLNNTGDIDLNFTINSTQSWVGFNGTDRNLTIRVNNTFNTTTFNVTANTTGFAVGEYNFNVTIYAFTINPTLVSSQAVSGKVVVQNVAGPFFTVTITNYDATVTQGDTGVNLSATVKNDGTGDATQAWLAWTLPSGWSNTSGVLNKSIGFLGVGTTVANDIIISISSSATTGTFTLLASAGSAENVTGNDTKTVTVSSPPPAPSAASASGGGGGGAAAPVITEEQKTLLLQTNETFELVRGLNDTFLIKVENPFKNTNFTNITLNVTGFLVQYISITPLLIESIGYNKSAFFKITITAPTYLTKGFHQLNFTIKGRLTGTITTLVTENRIVILAVHEVTRQDANESITQSEKSLLEILNAGFSANSIKKLLDQAKKSFEDRDYEKVKDVTGQIVLVRNTAFSTHTLIKEVEENIEDAENRGLRVDETKNLLNLALAAFEREDYISAEQRIRDAQLVYAIETVGKVNYVKLLMDYWWAVIISTAAVSVAGMIIYRRMIVVIIARKLEDLNVEEGNITELMKETQRRTYVEKTMSAADYHKTIYEYEKRLSEIRETRAKLRAKRVGIIKVSKELDNLKKEDEGILNLMKTLQREYFEKRSIGKPSYTRRMEAYKLRRAELEEAIAVLEAKLAKKRRLEKLQIGFKQKIGKLVGKGPEKKSELKVPKINFGELFDKIKKSFEKKKISKIELKAAKEAEKIPEVVKEIPEREITPKIKEKPRLSKPNILIEFGKALDEFITEAAVKLKEKITEWDQTVQTKRARMKENTIRRKFYSKKQSYQYYKKAGATSKIVLGIKRFIGKLRFKVS